MDWNDWIGLTDDRLVDYIDLQPMVSLQVKIDLNSPNTGWIIVYAETPSIRSCPGCRIMMIHAVFKLIPPIAVGDHAWRAFRPFVDCAGIG